MIFESRHNNIDNKKTPVTFQKPYFSMIASTNLIITAILSGIDTFPLCSHCELEKQNPDS